MNTDYIIKLTFSVYRLTESWEEERLLRLRLRRTSSEILKDFILVCSDNPGLDSKKRLHSNLSDLEKALRSARREKMMERKTFVYLQKEYSRVRDWVNASCSSEKEKEVKQEEEEKKEGQAEKKRKKSGKKEPERLKGLKQREKKILSILQNEKQAQVSELKRSFPDISKRTLRRDIDSLLKKNLIARHGKWNDVYYTLA